MELKQLPSYEFDIRSLQKAEAINARNEEMKQKISAPTSAEQFSKLKKLMLPQEGNYVFNIYRNKRNARESLVHSAPLFDLKASKDDKYFGLKPQIKYSNSITAKYYQKTKQFDQRK